MIRRVALLARKFDQGGGLEKSARALAKSFSMHGADVTLLTQEASEKYRSIEIPKRGFLSYRKLKNYDIDCQKVLKQESFDIIFGLERNSSQTHYRAGSGVHRTYLQRRNELEPKAIPFAINPLHRTILQLEKSCFEDPKLRILFTNSKMVKEEILEHYQTAPEKISVIYNGVEWEQYEQPFSKRCCSASNHLLFIGHGFERKGLALLLKALGLLKNLSWKLTVVGKDKNIKKYQSYAKKLKILEKIDFAGETNPLPYLQQADTLIIPSIYDPMANVTLEALAMGLYVISSPYNGGKELLTEESGVVLNSLTDSQRFAQTIEASFEKRKEPQTIRQSVKEYTQENQLNKIVNAS